MLPANFSEIKGHEKQWYEDFERMHVRIPPDGKPIMNES